MNVAIFLFVLLFCDLTLAQDDLNAVETELTSERHSVYYPDILDLLREFDSMKDKLVAMETRLKHSENEIVELRIKERIKVVFSAAAGGGATIGPFGADANVIYRRVITNIGDAYSQFTGIFTVPVAGVYYFTIFNHAGGELASKLYLYKNQQLMAMSFDPGSSYDAADNSANGVFLQLQRGDQVYVRLAANTHLWGSDYLTTFSGCLLSQM